MSIRKEIQTAPNLATAAHALSKAASHPGMTGKGFRRCQRAFDERKAYFTAPAVVVPVQSIPAAPVPVAVVQKGKALSTDPRAVAKRAARAAAKLAPVVPVPISKTAKRPAKVRELVAA